MSGTLYRRQPTLQEILGGGVNGAAPVATSPSQAPIAPGQAALSPEQQRNNLYAMLTQPEDMGPAPEVSKRSPGAEVLGGIGDALGAYAAALANNPALATHTLDRYFAEKEAQKAELRRYNRDKAQAGNSAKIRGAQFLIDEQDRSARAAELADKKIQAEQDRMARKAEKDQAAALETAKLAQDQAQFQEQKSWQEKQTRLNNTKDIAVARIHAAAAGGDEHAKFDQKKLPEVMGYIGELADSAQVALAGGDAAAKIPGMTKDVMINRVRRLVEGSGLSADAKKAIYAFAESELGGEFRDFEAKQAAQAQQGTTVEGQPALSPADQAIGGAIGAIPGVLKNVINPYPQKR